ncbi:MAG: hypothetical protein P8188_00745 [Gemmatimonadota bacterium]
MTRRPGPRMLLTTALLLVLPGAGDAPTAPHDLHMTYGDLAVEGRVIAGRIRMFKEDLERALGPMVGADALSLSPGSEADALVMRYLRDHLEIEVEGRIVEPRLLESGQDELDREVVWWVLVQYEAPSPAERFTVRNRLFFELFDDQRNVFKFVRFPEEVQLTFTFTPGESEHVVRLQPGARDAREAIPSPGVPWSTPAGST